MPRVSIITALYNHEKYVEKAIESVLSQTFSDWEFIIWDDGSKDNSLTVARRYEAQNPSRIKVFTHSKGENRGQENTRNEAIKHASGDLICLLDSDDWFHPKKLEWLISRFEDKKVGLAYGRTQIYFEPTGEVFESKFKSYPQGNIFSELLLENFIGAAAVLFRNECLSQTGFDSKYRTMGEYPLWLNIAAKWKVAHVPETVAWWRSHGKNQSILLDLESRKELVDFFESLQNSSLLAKVEDQTFKRALAQRRYDYASALYQVLKLSECKKISQRIIFEHKTPQKLRLKAILLWSLSFLGTPMNQPISAMKKKIWEKKNPLEARRNNYIS